MTETALPVSDALTVKDGEIPLPPPEMWAELDNSGTAAAAIEAVPEPAPSAKPVVALPVATLEFVGDEKPFRVIPLRYPFRWDGRIYNEIRVSRLNVQQMGAFWEGLPADKSYDRTDVFALMCGLPASVIRALPDSDGFEVTGACHDFLPLALADESA